MSGAFFRDLQYGWRSLGKSPGFAIAAILTLGLAIGATTAVFSVVRAVLLKPLPFHDPSRLVQFTGGAGHESWLIYRDLADVREQCSSFESIGAARFSLLDLTGIGEPQALYGAALSSDMLTTLGVQPLLGRGFLPDDDRPGHDQVVILSYQLWQGMFAGDPAIVGQYIQLSGPRIQNREIIGVMPPDFNFPLSVPNAIDPPSRQRAFWVPLGLDILEQKRDGTNCMAVARLKPGVSVAEAQAEVNIVMARLKHDYPDTNKGRELGVTPLLSHLLATERKGLLAIWFATALVLLIGSVNIANLLLARASNRIRETGIRLALGAGRRRLFTQGLTESLLLGGLGCIAGLGFAIVGEKFLIKLAPHGIPRIENTRIDFAVLAFSAAISILSSILFGVVPAWRAAGHDPLSALRESGASAGGARKGRGLLIVAEVALCVPLATGALLFVESYQRLMAVDRGFNSQGVITSIILLHDSRYPDLRSKITFYNRLIDRLEDLPGVEAAGAVNGVPLSGNFGGGWISIDGHPSDAIGDDRPSADIFSITPDYLSALGVSLRSGRNLTREDVASGAKTILVNEATARHFFPNEDPIGKRINLTNVDKPGEWRSIIGVVTDTRDASIDQPAVPAVYIPIEQGLATPQFLTVRTSRPLAEFAQELRRAVSVLDKNQPIFLITSMEDLVNNSVAPRRYSASLISFFGFLAVTLAAVGVYGVVGYSTSKRTREIGLRLALGASRFNVLRVIVGEGLVWAVSGIVIGLAATFALSQSVASLLYGVTATDPKAFLVSTILLLAIAVIASYMPARRALKIDPMAALRDE